MGGRLRSSLIAIAVLALSQQARAQADVLLHVADAARPWGEQTFSTQMQNELAKSLNLRVSVQPRGDSVCTLTTLNVDSLANVGRANGTRYYMLVTVTDYYIEHRKTFNIPVLFHKYESFGVAEGEYWLIDCERSRLVSALPFRVERKGPRIFQAAIDGDENDPELHLTPAQKERFFEGLDRELAKWCVEQSKPFIRKRNSIGLGYIHGRR